jgi:hypothetical protein
MARKTRQKKARITEADGALEPGEEVLADEPSDAEVAHGRDPEMEREILAIAARTPTVVYSRIEAREQLELVEGLMIQGAAPAQIRSVLRGRWSNISTARTVKLFERVKDRWQKERELMAGTEREATIRRIEQMRSWATGTRGEDGRWIEKPNFNALTKMESLLIEVHGLRAPTKIDVEVAYTRAMLDVVGKLEGEDGAELLAEAREQERLADLARKMLPAAQVTVVPEAPKTGG